MEPVERQENILVAVRARRLLERELKFSSVWDWDSDQKNFWSKKDVNPKKFSFDRVFTPEHTNDDVHSSLVTPIIDSVLKGFNATIFAYGQTGSGKTHTMLGTDDDPGVTVRSIDQIFRHIEGLDRNNVKFLIRVAYIEIYNETVCDLFVSPDQRQQLNIFEDGEGGVVIDQLNEIPVNSKHDIFDLMRMGEAHRRYGATKMNTKSSRSHTILRLTIESCGLEVAEAAGRVINVSQLNLVDLAGSERASQTEAVGERLKEGTKINNSLMVLSQVISKLSDGNHDHVPYRNSKLTRILKNSLGGNSQTAMICTLSPVENVQTRSTLEFASRVKKIVQHAKKNEILDERAHLIRMENEMKNLKDLVKEMKNENSEMTNYYEQEIKKLQNQLVFNKNNELPPKASTKSQMDRINRRKSWHPSISNSRRSFAPMQLAHLNLNLPDDFGLVTKSPEKSSFLNAPPSPAVQALALESPRLEPDKKRRRTVKFSEVVEVSPCFPDESNITTTRRRSNKNGVSPSPFSFSIYDEEDAEDVFSQSLSSGSAPDTEFQKKMLEFEELQAIVEDLEAQKEALEDQNRCLESQTDKLSTEVERVQCDLHSLQDDLKREQEIKESVLASKHQLEAEVQAAQESIQSLEAQLASQNNVNNEETSDTIERLLQRQQELLDHINDVETAKAQSEEHHELEIRTLKEKISSMQEERELLGQKLEDLNDKISSSAAIAHLLEGDIEQMASVHSDEQEQEYLKLAEEKKTLQSDVESLKQMLDDAIVTSDEKCQELEAVQEQVKALTQDLSQEREDNALLTNEIKLLHQTVGQKEEELLQIRTTVEELSNTETETVVTLNATKDDLTKMKDELQKLTLENGNLKRIVDDLTQVKESSLSDLDFLKVQLDKQCEAYSALQERLEQVERACQDDHLTLIQSLQNDVHSLKEKTEKAETQCLTLEAEKRVAFESLAKNEEMLQCYRATEEALEAARLEAQAASETQAALEAQLDHQSEAFSALKESHEQVKMECLEMHQNVIHTLERDLACLREKMEQTESRCLSLEEEKQDVLRALAKREEMIQNHEATLQALETAQLEARAALEAKIQAESEKEQVKELQEQTIALSEKFVAAREKEKAKFQAKVQKLEDSKAELQAHCQAALDQVAQAHCERMELEKYIQEVVDQREALQASLDQLRAEIKKKNSEDSTAVDLVMLKKKVANLERDLKYEREHSHNLKDKIRRLQNERMDATIVPSDFKQFTLPAMEELEPKEPTPPPPPAPVPVVKEEEPQPQPAQIDMEELKFKTMQELLKDAPWANGSGAVKEHLLEAAKYRANKLNNEKNELFKQNKEYYSSIQSLKEKVKSLEQKLMAKAKIQTPQTSPVKPKLVDTKAKQYILEERSALSSIGNRKPRVPSHSDVEFQVPKSSRMPLAHELIGRSKK